MFLPNSQHFSKEVGNPTSPPSRKPKYKSYAHAVKKSSISVSLMHEHITHPHSDEQSKLRTLQSRIFRTSRTKGVHLFDISACKDKYSDLQSLMILKQTTAQNTCLCASKRWPSWVSRSLCDQE
jgi:hypothetical protein